MKRLFLSVMVIIVILSLGMPQAFSAWGKKEESAEALSPAPESASASAQTPKFKPREVKLDRNYDGIVDRVEVYNDEGIIQRVELDSSGDGKIDEWIYYEGAKAVRSEKDTKLSGKPDTFLTYDAAGVVIKSEVDSDGDSKTDEWVYYKEGKPVKAEKDTNKDGKADTFLSY